jgi:NADH dehydrogenase
MGVRPSVVVIGAGFGGLSVARGLAKQPVEVTLIDRQNFTTFQPLLYQVATSGLNPADVAYPVRGLFHDQPNLRFRRGEVTGVDWDTRTVELADQQPIPFDHLVVAAGTVVTWFDTPGCSENALPLYTLSDAVRLRNHIVERFEAADANPELIDQGALTFVVVGGGPTGVETAGALAELVAVVFRRDYPQMDIHKARVILVEARDVLLAPFHPQSQKVAVETLTARHVELRLDESVAEVGPDYVRLRSGETIPAETTVWAAGVTANPLAAKLGVETARGGRVVVNPDLTVPGHENVWAVGDVAAALGKKDAVLPQLAPVALQSGHHVARQIGRLLDGKPTRPFAFVDKGTMATIGRRAAVAELPGGIRLRGTLAWLSWLVLHIFYLAGLRNRASVLLNWFWGYVTWDRGPRLILRPAGQPDEASDSVPTHGRR